MHGPGGKFAASTLTTGVIKDSLSLVRKQLKKENLEIAKQAGMSLWSLGPLVDYSHNSIYGAFASPYNGTACSPLYDNCLSTYRLGYKK